MHEKKLKKSHKKLCTAKEILSFKFHFKLNLKHAIALIDMNA